MERLWQTMLEKKTIHGTNMETRIERNVLRCATIESDRNAQWSAPAHHSTPAPPSASLGDALSLCSQTIYDNRRQPFCVTISADLLAQLKPDASSLKTKGGVAPRPFR